LANSETKRETSLIFEAFIGDAVDPHLQFQIGMMAHRLRFRTFPYPLIVPGLAGFLSDRERLLATAVPVSLWTWIEGFGSFFHGLDDGGELEGRVLRWYRRGRSNRSRFLAVSASESVRGCS